MGPHVSTMSFDPSSQPATSSSELPLFCYIPVVVFFLTLVHLFLGTVRFFRASQVLVARNCLGDYHIVFLCSVSTVVNWAWA